MGRSGTDKHQNGAKFFQSYDFSVFFGGRGASSRFGRTKPPETPYFCLQLSQKSLSANPNFAESNGSFSAFSWSPDTTTPESSSLKSNMKSLKRPKTWSATPNSFWPKSGNKPPTCRSKTSKQPPNMWLVYAIY